MPRCRVGAGYLASGEASVYLLLQGARTMAPFKHLAEPHLRITLLQKYKQFTLKEKNMLLVCIFVHEQ